MKFVISLDTQISLTMKLTFVHIITVCNKGIVGFEMPTSENKRITYSL